MRKKLYGPILAVKLNATVNPLNKAKLELAAKEHGITVSMLLNTLIDMMEPPTGWDEIEKHLTRQYIQQSKQDQSANSQPENAVKAYE